MRYAYRKSSLYVNFRKLENIHNTCFCSSNEWHSVFIYGYFFFVLVFFFFFTLVFAQIRWKISWLILCSRVRVSTMDIWMLKRKLLVFADWFWVYSRGDYLSNQSGDLYDEDQSLCWFVLSVIKRALLNILRDVEISGVGNFTIV